MEYLVLTSAKESRRTQSALCAMLGKTFRKEVLLTALVPKKSVATAWIRVNAKKLMLEKDPDHPHARSFAASERWCRKLAKRHHLSKRRRSNMKNKSVEERLPQMMRFYRRLRRLLQQPPVHRPAAEGAAESDKAEVLPMQNPVYERFSLGRGINADQVGLAFVNGLKSTWNETGAKRVQISQPFAGLEKRQYTVNACFEPGAKLMRPAVIFRGKIPAVERAAYDPRVDFF